MTSRFRSLRKILQRIVSWHQSLFDITIVDVVIVRKYLDAKGNYVGELYINGKWTGASLDSLPFSEPRLGIGQAYKQNILDCENDFLADMPLNTIRVGGLTPQDNEKVRRHVAKFNARNMQITVFNRFIEAVLSEKA